MAPSITLDPLPYELHTDRELEFMLDKGKPRAHFSDAYPAEPDEAILPELAFAPYVEAGRFVKREFVEPVRGPPAKDRPHVRGIRHVFYARTTEAWHIDAYIMMMAAASKAGWTRGLTN
jgi:hypothetical protein